MTAPQRMICRHVCPAAAGCHQSCGTRPTFACREAWQRCQVCSPAGCRCCWVRQGAGAAQAAASLPRQLLPPPPPLPRVAAAGLAAAAGATLLHPAALNSCRSSCCRRRRCGRPRSEPSSPSASPTVQLPRRCAVGLVPKGPKALQRSAGATACGTTPWLLGGSPNPSLIGLMEPSSNALAAAWSIAPDLQGSLAHCPAAC